MKTILIVEDVDMNRELLVQLLEERYRLVIAEDGRAALACAAEEKPDLILMDLSLPVMDGWEATRQLKAEQSTRSIPVIALTAHAMSGDRQKAVEAGCDDFDTKPIELVRLLEKIEHWLGRAGAH